MDIEHVIFSVGQKDALDAYQQAFQLGTLAAHAVYFGDHLSATVFTSDTPQRLSMSQRAAIEAAVVEAGQERYVEELDAVYASRIGPRLGRYFMAMAQRAHHVVRQPEYVPALITS
jgi:hypothetical protein